MLYEPLGVSTYGRELNYWFRINQSCIPFRSSEMMGMGGLLAIYPVVDHWRNTFPKGVRRGVDIPRAVAALIRECWAKGEYVPPKP